MSKNIRRPFGRNSVFSHLLQTLCVLAVSAVAARAQVTHMPSPIATGSSSATVHVQVQTTSTDSVTSVLVLTAGTPNLDFKSAGNETCTALGAGSPVGTQCTVDVTFNPTVPGLRTGAVVLVSGTGSSAHAVGQRLLDGTGSGPLSVIRPGLVQTIAGSNAQWQYNPLNDGHDAQVASIFLPSGLTMDGAGNLYIADYGNNRIRKVTPPVNGDLSKSIISTYAGGTTATLLSGPAGIAMDGAGNLYIADSGNEVIRRIDAQTGAMTTVAGQVGDVDPYNGEGGLATAATLNSPWAVALDTEGNLFIADTVNNAVRRVDAVTHIITTVAQNLNSPRGIAFDPAGLLYIANSTDNTVIRVNADGSTTIYAGVSTPNGGAFGGDGGPANAAHLDGPAAIAFDAHGNLYIADSANNRVRRVSAGSNPTIVTVAGNGANAMSDTPVDSDNTSFSGPYAVYLDGSANLYVGDLFHNRVRLVSSNAALLAYQAIRVTKTSTPQVETVENDGTAVLTLGDLSVGNTAVFNQTALSTDTSTTCRSNGTVQPGDTCSLGIEFAPTQVSSTSTNACNTSGTYTCGSFTLGSTAANTPDVVTVYGQVLTVEPTSINLSSSANPAGLATAVTFRAVVAEIDGNNGNAIPTGTVTFNYTNGSGAANPLGPAVTVSGGVATITVSTLGLGQHTITANYSGNPSDAASSASLSESIVQNTSIALTASPGPSYATESVTLTAKLTSSTGNTPIAGENLVFFNGTTSIGSGTTDANGVVTINVAFANATAANAPYALTASFAGDSNNLKSTSNIVSQTVNRTTTSTMVSASPNSVNVGTNVTLTAGVSSSGGPTPIGTITFRYTNSTTATPTAVGTAVPLDNSGNAVLNTTALPPGVDYITAVYTNTGDPANSGSTSTGSVFVTVHRLLTSTSLSAAPSPGNGGLPETLTATVILQAGQTAFGTINGGTVTFFDNGTQIGNPVAIANGNGTTGTATLTTTLIPNATAHSLTATYNGNTDYDTSNSVSVSEQVNKSNTTTTLTPSVNTLIAGSPVTLTVVVAPPTGGVKVTGETVTLTDQVGTAPAQPLGSTLQLDATGKATLTLASLTVGTHNIVATYAGDGNYNTSTGSSTVTVSIGTTGLTLSATPANVQSGSTVTFNVALSTNGTLLANTAVTLLNNGATLDTITLNAQGRGTFTSTTLPVGTDNIVASFAGDADNQPIISTTSTVHVSTADTTTTLTTSASPATLGDSVIFTAKVTSAAPNLNGGTVNFMDGTANIGSGTVNAAGVATLSTPTLTLGQHSVQAIYVGDTTHSGSTSQVVPQQIVAASAVSLLSSSNPSIAGRQITLTTQVTSAKGIPGLATPTGNVTFQEGATVLGVVTLNASGAATLNTSTLAVGTHNITVAYAGDSLYQSNVSIMMAQVVTIATSNVTVAANPNPSNYGSLVTLTAHVTGTGGALTGVVNFLDGATAIGQATLGSDGTAVFTTAALAPGLHSISAAYAGDADNNAAQSSSITEQVFQAAQVALTSSENPAQTLDTMTLTATVRNTVAPVATGTVRFTDGTVLLGTATLTNGIATINIGPLTAANHSIVATYSGDVGDLAATSPALALVVNLRPTQVALTASAPPANVDGIITLIAAVHWTGSATPTGVLSFSTASGVIGTSTVDSAGVATLNITSSAINGSVTATYVGDAVYSGSSSASTDVQTIAPTNFTLAMTPGTISMPTKQYTTAKITLTSISGFSDTLLLGCAGLPIDATCTFDHDTVKLTANGSVVINLTVDTGSPLGSGGAAASLHRPQSNNGMSTTLATLPVGALLAWLLFCGRARRRLPATLLLLLVTAMALMPLTGCGGININSTPPGAYTFSITAVGQGTGVTLSQKITMTVTK